MSYGEILLAVVQLLGGGVIGYLTGLWQGRRQTQYQRRVEVVAELRRRLRELRESFANMATPPEWRLQEEQFGAEEVEDAGKKLDALSGYFQDNSSWLDKETRERLDDLTDEYAFRWADVRGCVDREEDPEGVLRNTWDWLEQAADEVEEIDKGFDSLLGTNVPWWRRIFG